MDSAQCPYTHALTTHNLICRIKGAFATLHLASENRSSFGIRMTQARREAHLYEQMLLTSLRAKEPSDQPSTFLRACAFPGVYVLNMKTIEDERIYEIRTMYHIPRKHYRYDIWTMIYGP